MTDDLFAFYNEHITSAARAIGRGYYNYTSVPDIEQELWMGLYKQPALFRKYKDQWPESRGFLVSLLKRKAYTYCNRERDIALGITPEKRESSYSVAVVRELLPDVFDYQDWQSFAQKTDSQAKVKRLEATSDRLAMLIDVKTAVDKLDSRNYSIVIAVFKHQYDDAQLAEMLEISTGSVKTTINRALNALVKILSPDVAAADREYVGTRKVKSNAASRAEVSNAYEGA
jgi:RNA polymerase sigma factor (sigma-70 family)